MFTKALGAEKVMQWRKVMEDARDWRWEGVRGVEWWIA